MAKILSIHSFRGGTGKSNTTANLSILLAAMGKRVAVVDTDIQSPGVHVLFGLEESDMLNTLNDYLWGSCTIEDAVYDLTTSLDPELSGKVFLVPASIKAGEIARILREGYDVGMLSDGFWDLIDALSLDFLIVDTHPGLNEETLLSIAISDSLIIVLRPDQQDYQGTSVTVDVARQLDVPDMMLVVNKLPKLFDPAEVRDRLEKTYDCDVAAILPHSDNMMVLGSANIFALQYPDHSITRRLQKVANRLVA